MTADPRTRAEIVKLARLLGEDPARFDYLAGVPAADVRAVRGQATDVLFGTDRAMLERIGAASRLVPAAITATIAQKAFGALLSARLAGVLDPDRAIDIAGRLPVGFLADVAAELDPRRVSSILAALPLAQVVRVGEELVRRRDFVTMGRFVGELPQPSLEATVTALDEESLLRVSIYTDDEERVVQLLAMLPDRRIAGLARAILSADEEFSRDLVPLLDAIGEDNRARLAEAVRGLPEAERSAAADRAKEFGVLEQWGSIGEALSA